MELGPVNDSSNCSIPYCEDNANIPAQVEVAFDAMRWANSIESGVCGEGRKLSSKERAIYESSLEVLRLYLTGEMTFDKPKKTDLEKADCRQTIS